MIHWSSFPSDHAALFFALATSMFFVSRRAGTWRCCTRFLWCRSRGFTWECTTRRTLWRERQSAWVLASLAKITVVRMKVAGPAMRWLEKYPQTFYPGLFLLTFLITVIFNPVRRVALIFFEMMEIVIRHPH